MLTRQLRELERDGIVNRKQFNEIPARVEFSLTELGKTFQPLGTAIAAWRGRHMNKVEKARKRYDRENGTS